MKNIVKNYTRLIAIFAVALASFSCSTEDPISSTVTVYPTFNMTGDRITVITEGEGFTEPGVQAFIGEEEVEVTTTGTVDPDTPGVYDIYYSAVNEDGFAREIRRIVIVLSSEPSTINLEGTFFRNGFPNNVTRLGDRVYRADNAGGLDPTLDENIPILLNVIFYNIDDEHVYIPYQENASPSGVDVESNLGTIVSENNFNWVLFASATYGTALRNFVR